jgi:uncharacterized protein YerC
MTENPTATGLSEAERENSEARWQCIAVAAAERNRAAADYRDAVVDALVDEASFDEVSSQTGLSASTLQRWKRWSLGAEQIRNRALARTERQAGQ